MKPSVSRILRASFFFKFVDWLTNEKNLSGEIWLTNEKSLSGEIWLTNEKSLSGEMRIDFQSRIMYDDDARVKTSDADRVCTGRHLSLKLYMLYAACKEPFD